MGHHKILFYNITSISISKNIEFLYWKTSMAVPFKGAIRWIEVKCLTKWCLCMNRYPQTLQVNCGNFPHSTRLCLNRDSFHLYDLPQVSQKNLVSLNWSSIPWRVPDRCRRWSRRSHIDSAKSCKQRVMETLIRLK